MALIIERWACRTAPRTDCSGEARRQGWIDLDGGESADWREVLVLHLPRMIEDVPRCAAEEVPDRPFAGRNSASVMIANRLADGVAMGLKTIRREHGSFGCLDAKVSGVASIGAKDVLDDLVAIPATTSRPLA